MLEPGAGEHAASGVESGRAAADQVLRDLERGPRQHVLRQRLQERMGDVHPPSVRGRTLQMDAARSSKGRAACRSRAAELEGAALDRYPAVAGVTRTLNLPVAGCKLAPYVMRAPRGLPAAKPPFNRIAYAAAHVVADPLAEADPWLDTAIDWERTVAFRRHLWSLGLGVAEAMDTAQRGMGMDWPASLELIRRSVAAAKANGGALVFSGAGTDQLAPDAARDTNDVIRAYEEQIAAIEAA